MIPNQDVRLATLDKSELQTDVKGTGHLQTVQSSLLFAEQKCPYVLSFSNFESKFAPAKCLHIFRGINVTKPDNTW